MFFTGFCLGSSFLPGCTFTHLAQHVCFQKHDDGLKWGHDKFEKHVKDDPVQDAGSDSDHDHFWGRSHRGKSSGRGRSRGGSRRSDRSRGGRRRGRDRGRGRGRGRGNRNNTRDEAATSVSHQRVQSPPQKQVEPRKYQKQVQPRKPPQRKGAAQRVPKDANRVRFATTKMRDFCKEH